MAEPKNAANVISPPLPLTAVLLLVSVPKLKKSRSIAPPVALAPLMVIVPAFWVKAAPATIKMSPAFPVEDAVEMVGIVAFENIESAATRAMPPGDVIEPFMVISSPDAIERLAAVVTGRST